MVLGFCLCLAMGRGFGDGWWLLSMVLSRGYFTSSEVSLTYEGAFGKEGAMVGMNLVSYSLGCVRREESVERKYVRLLSHPLPDMGMPQWRTIYV